MKMTLSQKSQKIESFTRLYQEGMDAWRKAGEIIVELVEADSGIYDEIISKCPMLTPSVLATFERIGRGLLYAPLAMDGSPGGKRLQSLPLSQQVKYESEPIPLIVNTDNGTDILMVRAKDMTRDQASQAFVNGRIRTEGEQKAMLIEMKSKASPSKVVEKPWSFKGSKVMINGVEFTRRELAGILAQMD